MPFTVTKRESLNEMAPLKVSGFVLRERINNFEYVLIVQKDTRFSLQHSLDQVKL